MKKTKESDVQKQILQWLTMKKIFHWRNNRGVARFGPRYVEFGGKNGAPDIFAVDRCRLGIVPLTDTFVPVIYAIEAKRASGGKHGPDQIKWQEEAERNGIVYVLARSLDDVIKVMEPTNA